jgi:hypothetical protein
LRDLTCGLRTDQAQALSGRGGACFEFFAHRSVADQHQFSLRS